MGGVVDVAVDADAAVGVVGGNGGVWALAPVCCCCCCEVGNMLLVIAACSVLFRDECLVS
jgi:hypothetical protein